MIQNNNSNLVRGYAKAVFAIANQLDIPQRFLLFLEFLNYIIKTPSIKKIITNSAVYYLDKADLLIKIINTQKHLTTPDNQNNYLAKDQFANNVKQTEECNFIKLLAKKKHLLLIPSICEQYDKLYLQNNKKLRVNIVSAVLLDDTQQQNFKTSLTKYFNKELLLTFNIDSSIIAGIVIKYDDEIIDYSFKKKLFNLKQNLKNN